MANRIQIQEALRLKYNRVLFAKEILSPIFGPGFSLHTSAVDVSQEPNQTEARVIQKAQVYGKIVLDDTTEVNCYEILLQPQVRIEQSKVAIQHYVRKMLTSGQAALINFVSPTYENTWRLTLVAKDSIFTEKGVKEKTTHAKRFTFLLGPSETCKTAAERFEAISTEKQTSFELLVKAFSVERLSKIFFDEYKKHYDLFVDYLVNSNFKTSAFESDGKAIRDFTKKLLGRIVFLYFVQKKGWMGASNSEYTDGDTNFMMNLFTTSGGNETFYSVWLTKLFFDTLNTKERKDDFALPDGKKVKIPYLNGGLFDKEEHDDNILVLKPSLFHNPENADDPAQRGFLDFLNSFNFTVFEDSPEEHTIAVDPEMLGHIFENLLEDNKDKGAFYTPKEIVHYMCQESLTEYLATHLAKEFTLFKPLGDNQLELFGNESRTGQISLIEELGDKALNREHVEHIVSAKDINGLSTQQLKCIDALLDSVKICDPAIGSGAFPMGLLQEVFAIKEIIAYQLDIPWLPATVKENIIQNSIYGVDIEKGAVDIARLRFWLSLVVDEDKPKALPNLDYKIVVGNSLVSKFEDEIIEIDWSLANNSALKQSRPDLFKKFNQTTCIIIDKQKQYFSAEGSVKNDIAVDIRNAKIELLQILFEVERQKLLEKGIQPDFAKNKKEATIITERKLQCQHLQTVVKDLALLKENPVQTFNHFDWKLDFPEVLNPFVAGNNAGFDIVIGNPPYIQLQKDSGMLAQMFEKSRFETFERMGDIYSLFYEKGVQLLKKDAILTFITSNKWMRTNYGKSTRKFFTQKTNPLLIIDFGNIQLFENATVDANILITQNSKNKNYIKACRLTSEFNSSNSFESYILTKAQYVSFTNENAWVISESIDAQLIYDIKEVGIPLKDWDITINYGIKTGLNEAFIIDSETKDQLIKEDPKSADLLKPILRGKDIQKWIPEYADLWLVTTFPSLNIEISKYPAIHNWFLRFGKEKLIQDGTGRKKTGNDWFETQDQIAYWKDFEKPKIIYPNMTKYLPFVYDEFDHYYHNDKSFHITGKGLKWLVAFFNSKLFKFAFSDEFPELQGGTRELRKVFFDKIPVIKLTENEQLPFNDLVDKILEAKKANPAADTTNLEAEIDKLVYELYELTPEEIEIIEGKLSPEKSSIINN